MGAELAGRITNQTTLMSTPILDPSLPADNASIVADQMGYEFADGPETTRRAAHWMTEFQ
jgi:hypothetical protein